MSLKDIIKKSKLTKDGILIPLKVDDIILTGKFRNKKTKVKSIEINELGIPTVNGKPIVNFRYTTKDDIKEK